MSTTLNLHYVVHAMLTPFTHHDIIRTQAKPIIIYSPVTTNQGSSRMKRSALRNICIGTLVCAAMMAVPANAIFGIGLHYGMDFSLSMPDKVGAQVAFNNLSLNTVGTGFSGAGVGALAGVIFKPSDIPIYIDRSGLERTVMNLGGKIYVDVIPFIDAIELSGNFGVWQYNGRMRYPTGISVDNGAAANMSLLQMQTNNLVHVTYDTMDLTLKSSGVSFLGMSETPYAKLQAELNIRKYLKIPVIGKVIKPYAGAGANINFATPALSAGLVDDAIGSAFTASAAGTQLAGPVGGGSLVDVMTQPDVQKKIVEELLKRLFTPHYGAQVLVGIMIKPPIIPLALYVDGKYMIPFGPYDKDANITGFGFLVNAGIALAF
jgi:hypothetical protein